jgi:benzoyl-CoA reductase/2-hydroxyglutaryl-CoA dehydratase subunit BcrC/BadD/HgdB
VACATAPKDLLAAVVAALRERLDAVGAGEGISDYRARLMVFGSQIDDPAYLGIIESMGGLVVADRFCFGSLPQLVPIPEVDDPLAALAAHSLRKTPCPRMMEAFDERVDEALRVVEAFAVDGVVLETMKFCDTWGVESSPLVDALRRADVPVLRLEREYALTGEGQMRTRIQAFLESMGR